MMNEIWKPIKGYEGCYSVSNLGRVKSESRFVKWGKGEKFVTEKILKPVKHKNGYLFVSLRGKEKMFIYAIHRLVAQAFLFNFSDDKQVHHINEDITDNTVENLCVMTVSEHMFIHKQKYPKKKICVICGKEFIPDPTNRKNALVCSFSCKCKRLKNRAAERKKPVIQLALDGTFIKEWDSARDCQNETGFNETKICACCKNMRKTHKGYKWQYKKDYIENAKL